MSLKGEWRPEEKGERRGRVQEFRDNGIKRAKINSISLLEVLS